MATYRLTMALTRYANIMTALHSYVRVRTFGCRIKDRAALESWQRKRVKDWLTHNVVKAPAFAHLASTNIALNQLPVLSKADLMRDFSRYNIAGVTNDIGWKAFEGSKQFGEYTVGASTGTSGNRGLFVISERERFIWLGAILAKAIPDVWRHRERVAVLLPLNTPLYNSANQVRRLKLKFFDTTLPLEPHLEALEKFDPSIIIAPPRILRALARAEIKLSPRLIFSAAEKLEAFDRSIIEVRYGEVLREIYMATEGLLAVSCAHGRLHLCEDCMHFELTEEVNGLVSPIISDFSRTTQIMARYRMNDLLRVDPKPCACGSSLMVVSEVVGRVDDVLQFADINGQRIEIAPDILRNAIVDTDRRIDDFRLVQTGPEELELQLPLHCSDTIIEAVSSRLLHVLKTHRVVMPIRIVSRPIQPSVGIKLRRVMSRMGTR